MYSEDHPRTSFESLERGAGKFAGEVELFYSGLGGSLLIIQDLELAWGLHFQGRWGRRTEDPFRGLRAGPVRYSPLFIFAERWLGILSQASPSYPPQHTPDKLEDGGSVRWWFAIWLA